MGIGKVLFCICQAKRKKMKIEAVVLINEDQDGEGN
jgi:hypothetical protein